MSQNDVQEFHGADGRLYRIAVTDPQQEGERFLVRCAEIDEPGGSTERLVRDSLVRGRDEAQQTVDLWMKDLGAQQG